MIVNPSAIELDLLKSDLVRSPGLHASAIYGPLFETLDPKRYGGYDEPPNPLLLALGTAWEKHFEYLLLANGIKVERPEEFMSPEGIAYSPDLILWNGIARLGELKYTSRSAKDFPTEQSTHLPVQADKWACQMMLYAYWLGINDCWLAVLFNNKPWAPELRMFDITWTAEELQRNYTMVMNFARHRGLLK
jgi:hypothetical protein